MKQININLIICEYPPHQNKGIFVSRLDRLRYE